MPNCGDRCPYSTPIEIFKNFFFNHHLPSGLIFRIELLHAAQSLSHITEHSSF